MSHHAELIDTLRCLGNVSDRRHGFLKAGGFHICTMPPLQPETLADLETIGHSVATYPDSALVFEIKLPAHVDYDFP